jgi:hypothetical protein
VSGLRSKSGKCPSVIRSVAHYDGVHELTVLERTPGRCYKLLSQTPPLQELHLPALYKYKDLSLPIAFIMVAATIGCSGRGTVSSSPPAPIVVNPANLDFGPVAVGVQKTNTVTVINSGGSASTISQISATGSGFSVVSAPQLPLMLSAGQSSTVTIAFAPPSAGPASGSFSVSISGSTSAITEPLSGNGLPPGHSVDLSWNASASSVVGYNVYRGTQSGGPYTRLNSSLQSDTTYSDTNVQPGTTYFYVVTALDGSSQESAFSNESMAVIPSS